ncbi:hypothetical protein Z945_3281 [Sulfitobacter noctilucae]|uniref:hypothetical protein n=1 Tax=Sulfitobacter noctilucae TaxID=1342302 RepID=UPI00046AE216|nr:hypothetical protein [Sulfitobacter noctilucae]KIN70817.1 hypothetical protein Z945_3281 [Sulfitobacter noctilucae]
MNEAKDIARKVAQVQDLLTEKFRVKQLPLPKMVARVGRRLPRGMQARAAVLSDAERLAGHPKLARQLDQRSVGQAHTELVAYLQGIDVADRRKGQILGVAGVIVFNLLIIVVAFVAWLWWRGYL